MNGLKVISCQSPKVELTSPPTQDRENKTKPVPIGLRCSQIIRLVYLFDFNTPDRLVLFIFVVLITFYFFRGKRCKKNRMIKQ